MISIRLIFVVVLSIFLSACAFSPQQLTITPRPEFNAERYGMGKPVVVLAEDLRVNKVLGSRGGAYAETSVVTIGNDFSQALIKAAEDALAIQGFDVLGQKEPVAQFKVIVDELSFDIPAQTMVSVINLKALMRVEVKAGGETYEATYKTQSDQKILGYPSLEKNQEIVNGLISDTMSRIFEDQKLKAFLSNI